MCICYPIIHRRRLMKANSVDTEHDYDSCEDIHTYICTLYISTYIGVLKYNESVANKTTLIFEFMLKRKIKLQIIILFSMFRGSL
jgi:hypothetical protein